MSDGTKIQWSEATWNFATGCTKVSAGCTNCYIERTPPFRIAGRKFDKPGVGGATGIVLHEDRLGLPLRWRKPRRIFVNSLADIFHAEVPTELVAKAFAVMVAAPHHTFQLLTKRHARMRAILTSDVFWLMVSQELGRLWNAPPPTPLRTIPDWIWVGVSVESQQWAEPRIEALMDVPAAVRWVSAEPLLGPLNIGDLLTVQDPPEGAVMEFFGGRPGEFPAIRWVVGGGESGPRARPCDPDWLRSLRDQCSAAGVAYFNKQMGAVWARANGGDSHGGDWSLWPDDLKVRQYPATREAVAA